MFLLKYYLNHKKDMNYYQSNLLASLMHLVYHLSLNIISIIYITYFNILN